MKLIMDRKLTTIEAEKAPELFNFNNPPAAEPQEELIIDDELAFNFYFLEEPLTDIIFRELTTSPSQMKIMLVLCGTNKTDITDQWLCERTALANSTLHNAIDALAQKGWLSYSPSKEIKVNYQNIYHPKTEPLKLCK